MPTPKQSILWMQASARRRYASFGRSSVHHIATPGLFTCGVSGSPLTACLRHHLGNPQVHEYAVNQRDGSGGHVLGSVRKDRETLEKKGRKKYLHYLARRPRPGTPGQAPPARRPRLAILEVAPVSPLNSVPFEPGPLIAFIQTRTSPRRTARRTASATRSDGSVWLLRCISRHRATQ